MKSSITERIATNGLLIILSLFVVLHLLVMLNVIPVENVWGGRLKDKSEMLTFEAVSIIINLVMLAAVGIKAGLLKLNINPMILKIAFWIMAGIFLLNTIGNFLSNDKLKKRVCTIDTYPGHIES